VTDAAERASAGCADAVRTSLSEAKDLIIKSHSVEDALEGMNMCPNTLPEYIIKKHTLSDEVMSAVGFTFADFDSGYYPPGPDMGLRKACNVFQDTATTPLEKIGRFFRIYEEEEGGETPFVGEGGGDCFDLSVFLPDGDNARITTSDWSGSGGGNDGKMWDFQLCTTVIDPIGFSPASMFPPRKWTYDGLTKYCRSRYGEEVTPRPHALAEDLGFDDLVGNGASRILFTNGMQDMWIGGSYTEDLSDTILALNFENGAHHSDLSHAGPTDADTDDIKEGFVKIQSILEGWLHDVKAENEAGRKSSLLQQEK
jgi:lysosomal Pro-X carboxypeptidase